MNKQPPSHVTDNTLVCDTRVFPHIGQRIIKTTIAVYLCFLITAFRGRYGLDMTAEAAIAAIICMQPYVQDARAYAINRITGTLIGTVWGMLFLLLVTAVPAIGANRFVLYALMACGVLLALYSAVLFRQPDASSLSAIVFICLVIAFPEIEEPFTRAGTRVADVLIGTGVSIVVNTFRLPRSRNRNLVFFLRIKDLVPDRFSQIAPAALFRLNHLYNDGAKICLMSEHAPAFLVSQMSAVKMNMPLIVMDGAAVYDMNENKYLYVQPVAAALSGALAECLDRLGIGYFVYTIHGDKTCIFHRGPMITAEEGMYAKMKRSPYRSYLEGEIYDTREIVYFKIINTPDQLERVLRDLYENNQAVFYALRPVVRPHSDDPSCKALYFYSGQSSVQNAQAFLMEELAEKEEGLSLHEVRLRRRYHSERDAMYLLHKVERRYAPVKWPWKRRV